jgi:hypothetical protein
MNVQDLDGKICVDHQKELLHRLRSVRKGPYGAFILFHDQDGPSLWIHTNKDVAYLHFFPGNRVQHPGFQPTGMSPPNCAESVNFLITPGDEGDSIEMPREALVPATVAYNAATEFLRNPVLPPSVTWFEL